MSIGLVPFIGLVSVVLVKVRVAVIAVVVALVAVVVAALNTNFRLTFCHTPVV